MIVKQLSKEMILFDAVNDFQSSIMIFMKLNFESLIKIYISGFGNNKLYEIFDQLKFHHKQINNRYDLILKYQTRFHSFY